MMNHARKHHTQLTETELATMLNLETEIEKAKPAVSAILQDAKVRNNTAHTLSSLQRT